MAWSSTFGPLLNHSEGRKPRREQKDPYAQSRTPFCTYIRLELSSIYPIHLFVVLSPFSLRSLFRLQTFNLGRIQVFLFIVLFCHSKEYYQYQVATIWSHEWINVLLLSVGDGFAGKTKFICNKWTVSTESCYELCYIQYWLSDGSTTEALIDASYVFSQQRFTWYQNEEGRVGSKGSM